MRTSDQETLSIAAVVSDVLEGKKATEEAKYPHKMYDPKTGEEVTVKDEEEHEKYNKLGWVHDKPKMESPEEPRAQGEKDFKDKHTVKKSGAKDDGTIVKEESIEEAKGLAKTSLARDLESLANQPEFKKFKKPLMSLASRAKKNDKGAAGVLKQQLADIAAKADKKAHAKKFTKMSQLAATFESVQESADVDEASEKQKKYQAFFQKALKKYGVKTPAELDKEKRKEFFNYVDKNYEAENETD